MNTYEVTIRATLTKTRCVEAEDIASAEDAAHETFTWRNDGLPEEYDQETLRIEPFVLKRSMNHEA